ncbi:MAG TPA: glycosyltransferase family 4 protein [Bryobacteraceae bacterium]|nr:glycosyltransferase family 4 protein [Bryobacteraceae bacterium]
MRIAFISAVFTPEREPAAVMAAQLAGRWIRDGHQVEVYCPFPNRPEGRLRAGWKRGVRQVESRGNFTVIRCWHWLVGRDRRIWNRLLENASFGMSAVLQALPRGRPDLLVISTWPFAAAGLAVLLAKWWRIPAIYYVQDLYPEAAVEAGMLRAGHSITRLLTAFDRCLCRSSARIVLASETMREIFTRSRPDLARKVTVIDNWIDADEIKPLAAGDEWRREHGIGERVFLATFAGNLGLLSGAGILIRVAEYLRDRPDIFLLCVGEGVLKRGMAAEAARRGLANLRFLPFQPRESIARMHSAADALILTLRPGGGSACVPSKLITYLAAGRPVVCSASPESESHAVIRRSGAGINVAPGNPRAIANALAALARDRDAVERMSLAARSYCIGHFTADRALMEFGRVLHSLS